MKKFASRLNKLMSLPRLLICVGFATLALTIALYFKIHFLSGLLLFWDTFSLFMILISWLTFFTVPHIDSYLEAKEQDERSSVIFVLVLFSICISLTGIIILMKADGGSVMSKNLHKIVSLLGVALSWILLHTIFTLHYAHFYYADDENDPEKNVEGLDFPNEKNPDYIDFAYYSFVIGMTFQVSDVDITSKKLRRITLLHSVISFVFNTIIVALTISLLSNSVQ